MNEKGFGEERKETLFRFITSTLLGSIRVVLLVNRSPDARYHEVFRAVCVGDDAVVRVNV